MNPLPDAMNAHPPQSAKKEKQHGTVETATPATPVLRNNRGAVWARRRCQGAWEGRQRSQPLPCRSQASSRGTPVPATMNAPVP